MTNLPTIAILAGGRGTRLMPLTADRPKCLVEVAGRPFIEWQLERLRDGGITDVVLCVGYRGEQVREVVGDGSRFGLRIRYSFDGDKSLGTGGAIQKALPLLSDPFFVLYGDTLLDIDYACIEKAFRASDQLALMTVYKADGRDTPNARFRYGCVLRYNKTKATGEHLDYGLEMFCHWLFDNYSNDPYDLADIYGALARSYRMMGYKVTCPYHEIGSPEGLAETRAYLEGIQSR